MFFFYFLLFLNLSAFLAPFFLLPYLVHFNLMSLLLNLIRILFWWISKPLTIRTNKSRGPDLNQVWGNEDRCFFSFWYVADKVADSKCKTCISRVCACVRPALNTFCPSSLSPQMHHPIQMKPADSEKSNGEWLHTCTETDALISHTHTHINSLFEFAW